MALLHDGTLCDGYQGLRVHEDDGDTIHLEYACGDQWVNDADRGRCWPDLSDAATLGCILALVREAWTAPEAHVVPMLEVHDAGRVTFMWSCRVGNTGDSEGSTEAEALVAALEFAGGEE
jgi:hypothetical protein